MLPMLPPPEGTKIVGSRTYHIFHLTSGVQWLDNVQVTDKLPVPSLITGFMWGQSSAGSSTRSFALNMYLSNNDSLALDPAAYGELITWHRDIGTSPPDVGIPIFQSVAWMTTNPNVWIPLYIPVLQSPSYIKTVAAQTIVASCRWWIVVTVALLSGEPHIPGTEIVPRGTEAEPVCVRICPDGAPPPPPPPPPPPKEEEPEPPVEGINPLMDPLPAPCNIDPLFPLANDTAICDVP